MPIDQAFLDGLIDVPRVGEDGVSAPAEVESKPEPVKEQPVQQAAEQVKSEVPSEAKAEEPDAYQLLESLFEEVKPAAQAKRAEAKEESKQVAQPAKVESSELKFDSSFLPQTDEDFDKIIASRGSFVEFQNKQFQALHNFYEAKIKAVLDQLPSVQAKAVEEAMQKASEFVPQHIQTQLSLQKMVDKFYDDNPNLVPIRKVVGQVANKISAAHPEWGYAQVFAETAKQANRVVGMLNLPQSDPKKANGTGPKPAFAKTPSAGRKPAVERSGIQKDIDMLIS